MNKIRNRYIIWSMIALTMVLLHIGLIIIALPIFLIVIIDYLLCKSREKKEEIEEIPLDDGINVDQLRAIVEQIEQRKFKEIDYRRNVDLRQFKGRDNVTRQEVADYLWFHYVWEGRREKEIICEEIAKVSNITQEDIDWIMYDHYHHKGDDGSVGGGYWIRNEEVRREQLYDIKKTRQQDEEWDKQSERLGLPKRKHREKYQFIYYYEDWLKMKGYV